MRRLRRKEGGVGDQGSEAASEWCTKGAGPATNAGPVLKEVADASKGDPIRLETPLRCVVCRRASRWVVWHEPAWWRRKPAAGGWRRQC
jgi:hypothetical protein